MSEEVSNMSQSLQNCKNKFDLAYECLSDLVKDAVHEDKGEKKEELMTFINTSTEKLQEFTKMLSEEPKMKCNKRQSKRNIYVIILA